MLTSIKRYWAAVPASIAGPAFIAAGVLFAISGILNIVTININTSNHEFNLIVYHLMYLLGWLTHTAANLALFAGLAATGKRWAGVFGSLGKLGLLLAAIAAAVLTIRDAEIVVDTLISLIFTGGMGYTIPSIQAPIEWLIFLAGQTAIYARWGGMALSGVYVLRTKAQILPRWARALPLIIGLWGLLYNLFSGDVIRAILPDNLPLEASEIWSSRLDFLLYLPQIILWVLLGITLLSKQPVLPVQTEPVMSAEDVPVSS